MPLYPMPDLQQMEFISSTPLNVFIKPTSTAARFATQHNLTDLHSVQQEHENGTIPRQKSNCVIRSLPQNIAWLIRARNILNVPAKPSLIVNEQQIDIETASTKVIRNLLITSLCPDLVVDLNRIYKRRDLPENDKIKILL